MPKYQGKYQRPSRSRPFWWLGVGCGILALAFAFFVGSFLYGAVKVRNASRQAVQTYVTPPPSAPGAAPGPETTAEKESPEPTAPKEEAVPEATVPETTVPETTVPETTVPTEPPRFPTIDFAGLREKNAEWWAGFRFRPWR